MVVLPAIRIQPGLPVLPRHSAPLPGPLQRSVKALHLALSLWMSNAAPVQPNALSHQPQRQLRPPKLRVGAPPRRAVIHQHRFRNTAALEGFLQLLLHRLAMCAAQCSQRDQVATVIVQHRQRTHRLRPSLRPFEVHLPEFVGLTALEALRSRGDLFRSNRGDAICDEWCCAATASLRGPTAPEAYARPSRDNVTATLSPAVPHRCRCGADYGAAYGCALRSRPLPVPGNAAATNIRSDARSRTPRTTPRTSSASALPRPQIAPVVPVHPSSSTPSPSHLHALCARSVKDV